MMKSSTVCVDANILLRLVLFPQDAVNRLWENWQKKGLLLVAPALIYYEVVNALHQYQRQNFLSAEAAVSALDTILNLPVTLNEDPDLHKRALELAEIHHLPAAYDAHYLALAERLEVELWTADGRLAKALEKSKVDWVRVVRPEK